MTISVASTYATGTGSQSQVAAHAHARMRPVLTWRMVLPGFITDLQLQQTKYAGSDPYLSITSRDDDEYLAIYMLHFVPYLPMHLLHHKPPDAPPCHVSSRPMHCACPVL